MHLAVGVALQGSVRPSAVLEEGRYTVILVALTLTSGSSCTPHT